MRVRILSTPHYAVLCEHGVRDGVDGGGHHGELRVHHGELRGGHGDHGVLLI